jgi:hypothetical protein
MATREVSPIIAERCQKLLYPARAKPMPMT